MPPTTPPTSMPVFDLEEVGSGITVGEFVESDVVVTVGPVGEIKLSDEEERVEVSLNATQFSA